MPDPKIKSSLESGEVSPEEKAAIEKSLKKKEQAPRVEEQTESFTDWRRVRDELGEPFNNERIPFRKLRRMRLDPMFAFAWWYTVVPKVRAPFHFEAWDNDGPNPQVAQFCDTAYRIIHASYQLQRAEKLNFGFQVQSKRFQEANPGGVYVDTTEENPENQIKQVWNEGTILPIIWKHFVGLVPEKVEPVFDKKTGDFAGVTYELPQRVSQGGGGFSTGKKKLTLDVDVYHALWSTNERYRFWGSIYGYPRTAYGYQYWWSYWFRWLLADRAFERMAIPPLIAYHPDGEFTDPDDPTAEPIPNEVIAIEAARALRNNALAAVPSTLASTGLDEKGTTKREWEFVYLESTGFNFDILDKSFAELNVMKLRSQFVPEQAFIEGTGGSSSRNVAEREGDVFVESQGLSLDMDDEDDNRYLFPQVVGVNFPEFMANGGHIKKVSHGMSSADKDLLKQLVQLIGQEDPAKLGVNLQAALAELRVPIMSPAEMHAEKRRLIAEQQVLQPPLVDPRANGGLGVIPARGLPLPESGASNGGSLPEPNPAGSSLGFAELLAGSVMGRRLGAPTQVPWQDQHVYIRTPEPIFLADADDFFSSLPLTKHYSDETIRAMLAQLRKMWESHLHYMRAQLGLHTSSVQLDFADEGVTAGQAATVIISATAAKKAADKIMDSWQAPRQAIEDVAVRTRNVLERIVKRMMRLESNRIGRRVDLPQDEIDNWVDKHIGWMIKKVHKTTDRNLRTFLANQIKDGVETSELAQKINEHFEDIDINRAMTIARSEVRDAVNAGTLITGEVLGIRYVQAKDAQLGPTDADCEERDGKLYTIREAWRQASPNKTHSNDTLGFELMPRADFSIEHVDEMPESAPDHAVMYFDDESSTVLFLNSGANTPEDEDRYVEAVAKQLIQGTEEGAMIAP